MNTNTSANPCNWPASFTASVVLISHIFRLGFLLLALGFGTASWAQRTEDDPDWKESSLATPPAFNLGKLITFSGAVSSSLVYGVDPASITIDGSDSIVRYVMVASSASGAKNIMYEGIRCATGEFKTYARYSQDGQWKMVSSPQWRSMFDTLPSKHALFFARAGACDSAAPAPSVNVLVSRLKNPNFRFVE